MAALPPGYENSPPKLTMVCIPKQPYSTGIWNGHNSLEYAVPLLLLQISLRTAFTRLVAYLLKPLKQPKIVYEILGGLIIGPSFLGRSDTIADVVSPRDGVYMLRHIGSFGMVYFMFLIGVKTDPSLVLKMRKKALSIAICGMLLPLITVLAISSFLPKLEEVDTYVLAAVLSTTLTNFPVLHPILTEINLLNSDLGRLAMSLSMFNDGVQWIVFLFAGFWRQGHHNLLAATGMVIFIVFVFRPAMLWIIKQTPEGRPVEQKYIVGIMLMVFFLAFVSDIVGLTAGIGPMFMGLAIPDGPPLGAAIVEKTETITQEFFMPGFYACLGLVANVFDVSDFVSWGFLHIIMIIGYITKLLGTVLPCLLFKMPIRNALTLGFIMNFKGQSEMMNLLSMRHYKAVDHESFDIMVCSTLLMTAVTMPLVRYIYMPKRASETSTRRTIQHAKHNNELSILTCTHTEENVPSIISVLHASSGPMGNTIYLYVLHLMELVGRATSMLVAYDQNKRPSNPTSADHIFNAFKIYQKHSVGRVFFRPFISMSPFLTVHEDICAVALEKNASLIILPFHKKIRCKDELGAVDKAFRIVNPNVLNDAPCSVGILVTCGNRGATSVNIIQPPNHIGVVFLGGPDDREALAYAARMANQSNISLTILRILPLDDEWDNMVERKQDEELITQFHSRNNTNNQILYTEAIVKDTEAIFGAVRSMEGDYDLLIVGRRHEASSMLREEMMEWIENPELGVLGDIVVSINFSSMPFVLVMQQHTEAGTYTHAL